MKTFKLFSVISLIVVFSLSTARFANSINIPCCGDLEMLFKKCDRLRYNPKTLNEELMRLFGKGLLDWTDSDSQFLVETYQKYKKEKPNFLKNYNTRFFSGEVKRSVIERIETLKEDFKRLLAKERQLSSLEKEFRELKSQAEKLTITEQGLLRLNEMRRESGMLSADLSTDLDDQIARTLLEYERTSTLKARNGKLEKLKNCAEKIPLTKEGSTELKSLEQELNEFYDPSSAKWKEAAASLGKKRDAFTLKKIGNFGCFVILIILVICYFVGRKRGGFIRGLKTVSSFLFALLGAIFVNMLRRALSGKSSSSAGAAAFSSRSTQNKPRMRSMPASYKNCCTCALWGGSRQADFSRRYVKFDDSEKKGQCIGGAYDRSSREAMNTCSAWRKWNALK